MVDDTVDKEDSSDSLDSEPPGDKLRFLRFLRGRPFRFGAETVKFICIIYPAPPKKDKFTTNMYFTNVA